ncbi:MAG TPA: sensor histidine kinase KdpD [Verrucomicrobiae bacterium]|nr:sensor histidine kinase KdpD [Verrucomicrobiae bacterium]
MNNNGLKTEPLPILLNRRDAPKRRGRLRVFFGMTSGVGKTAAMLQAARREQAAGRDVVIGCLSTRGSQHTSSLAEGIPVVPPLNILSRGRVWTEMDLDGVLARRPRLVIVDDLGHSNPPGLRHAKRYQDVLELLEAQIDVYTALNVENVESRSEAVRQITGTTPAETVPDTILEGAEFELVDISPEDLSARLASDDAYAREAAWAAQKQIFHPGSLSALRELALRFVAEHISRDVRASRQNGHKGEPWKSGPRLMVAVGPGAASAALVRWTRRLAGELHATWVAVHVEPRKPLGREEQLNLSRHLMLAKELGAQVITTTDDDVSRGLLRVAREQEVNQIVLGKPTGWRAFDFLRGGSLMSRLVRDSGDIDVHAVRAERDSHALRHRFAINVDRSLMREYAISVASIAAISILNWPLQRWLGHQPLGMIYLLGVVVLGTFVRQGPTIVAAILSTLSWDYLYTPPVFSFRVESLADLLLTLTYFVVAMVIGNLTSRLRSKEASERRRERHATGLYLLTRALTQASHIADLLAISIEEVNKVTHSEVHIALKENGLEDLSPYPGSTWFPSEQEQKVALWAAANRQPAGRGTNTCASAEGLHVPLLAGERVLGVLSLRLNEGAPLTTDERDLLDGFVRQIALALDRERLRDAEHHAKLVAESERLSKILLNSVSHEIRTPLAAIMSAASSLSEQRDDSARHFRQEMVGEIQEASQRLNRLVGNLLNMSRLESGHMKPKLDWCDFEDLVQVTLDEIEGDLSRHRVAVEISPGLPLIRMDFVLMQQVLTNLLLNASIHTPAGTTVHLSAAMEADTFVMKVADNGPGLPAHALSQIFEKFYRAPAAPAGGTGLGLAIVKGLVEAHGGHVSAQNRPEGGSVFIIHLPSPGQFRRQSDNRYERLSRA